MAKVKVEKYVTDVNLLRFEGEVERGFYEGAEVGMAMYEGEVVFNRPLYHLEQPVDGKIELGFEAVDLVELFSSSQFSWKRNALGKKESVKWNINPSGLEANKDTSVSKTTEYRIWQDISGLEVSGTIIQSASPEAIDYIKWEDYSGQCISGTMFEFKARLIYRKSIAGEQVSITPIKNGEAIKNATDVTLSGSSYNTESNIMDVSVMVRTSYTDGDVLELMAMYGGETETIDLGEPKVVDPT